MKDRSSDNKYDIIVTGAGPSGLMAAIQAARQGASVLVLEQKDKPLKKLYATGNGRCNFSNLYMDDKVYRGVDPGFAVKLTERFGRDDLLGFFHDLGMMTKHIGDYIYPYNEQARTVADALLLECRRLGIKISCDERTVDITWNDDSHFTVKTASGTYCCRCLILAVGGKASPAHGSDGNLNSVIVKLGHTIATQRPALVPLVHNDKGLSKLAGVRVKCAVSLEVSGEPVSSEQGEIIFNKDNISGIPVMQMSRYATQALAEGKEVSIVLDFFPGETDDELFELLKTAFIGHFDGQKDSRRDLRRDRTALEALSLCLNEKLAEYCLKAAGVAARSLAGNISDRKLELLTYILHRFEVDIYEDAGFERAQVTAGGVSTDELTDELESRKISGLYVVGELADVDGTCGGYNLQWAFSSGALAGKHAGASIKNV